MPIICSSALNSVARPENPRYFHFPSQILASTLDLKPKTLNYICFLSVSVANQQSVPPTQSSVIQSRSNTANVMNLDGKIHHLQLQQMFFLQPNVEINKDQIIASAGAFLRRVNSFLRISRVCRESVSLSECDSKDLSPAGATYENTLYKTEIQVPAMSAQERNGSFTIQ